MSNCYDCGTEFTLKEEETKCDTCGKIVNFPCHHCHQWFSIQGEDGGKIKECKICGFFPCPNCGVCGYSCDKQSWIDCLMEILPNITNEQTKKILALIEDIKFNREQMNCLRGVPISYAKSRIKSCVVKLAGYRIKNQADLDKFRERLEEIRSKSIGTILTVNQIREAGSYGQEYRDVFNYMICVGELESIKIKKDNIEYTAYKRCAKESCPKLDLKDLIVKVCPNKDCKIKIYPRTETCCVCPECKYTKGIKKGQLRDLKIKISNKDTCQLSRKDFKKEEENGKGNII